MSALATREYIYGQDTWRVYLQQHSLNLIFMSGDLFLLFDILQKLLVQDLRITLRAKALAVNHNLLSACGCLKTNQNDPMLIREIILRPTTF